MWSFLLKSKDEAFETFKKFKAGIKKLIGCLIKCFRTDRGGEFNSHEFKTFCENTGISRQLTAPYTLQQNGVVERRNRTLMEMTRSIMKAMGVPNYLWGEAARYATYLINRVPTRALVDQTPYECFKEEKPNLEHLKVFGCLAYAKIEDTNLKKLDDRTRPLVHLGTEPDSKAYRFFNPKTRKIIISRDVVFNETARWNWEKNEDSEPGKFTAYFGNFLDVGAGPIMV